MEPLDKMTSPSIYPAHNILYIESSQEILRKPINTAFRFPSFMYLLQRLSYPRRKYGELSKEVDKATKIDLNPSSNNPNDSPKHKVIAYIVRKLTYINNIAPTTCFANHNNFHVVEVLVVPTV